MSEVDPANVVVFLGSGASRALNSFAPLDGELLDRIVRRLSANWLNDQADWDRVYTAASGFLWEHYRGRRAKLWDALMLLDGEGDRASRDLRDILESQIYGVASDIMPGGRSSMYHRQAKLFMRQLAGLPHCRVDFVTTNYDIVIDGYIPRHLNSWMEESDPTPRGYNIMYGLSQLMTKAQLWDGNNPQFDPAAVLPIHDPLQNRIRQSKLIKIHGSINWAYCSECGRPFLIHGSGAIEAMACPWRLPLCRNEGCKGGMLERMLVTPAEMERRNGPMGDQKRTVFAGLWKAAEDLLVKADLLIFIGYSLPPEDRQVRAWLAKANNRNVSNKRRHKALVVTLGDDPRLRESYESLFGDELVIFNEGLIRFVEKEILIERGEWVVSVDRNS